MKKHTGKFYQWAIRKAESRKAPLWVGVLFLLEVCLFLPLDAILIFFSLQNRRKTFLYVAIASLASTLSAFVGYLAGNFLWDLAGSWVIPHLISASSFARISSHLQIYEHWAVFFGGIAPFPLKALSVTAGVFHLGIGTFLLFFFAARLLRFALIGTAVVLWGEKFKAFVDRHFHRIFMIVGAKIAVAFAFFWALAR